MTDSGIGDLRVRQMVSLGLDGLLVLAGRPPLRLVYPQRCCHRLFAAGCLSVEQMNIELLLGLGWRWPAF